MLDFYCPLCYNGGVSKLPFLAVPQTSKFIVCSGCRAYGVPLNIDKLCATCYNLGKQATTFSPSTLPWKLEGYGRTSNRRVVYSDTSNGVNRKKRIQQKDKVW